MSINPSNSSKQKIAALVIIVILAYGAYRVVKHEMRLSQQAPASTAVSKGAPTKQPTQAMQNSVVKWVQKGKLGNVLTDPKGMTLYVFAKDSKGVSSCTGDCLKLWPAYTAPSKNGNLPADITIITRDDGALQYAYKGMPLYYYSKDKDNGDTYGNGVLGQWSVVKQ